MIALRRMVLPVGIAASLAAAAVALAQAPQAQSDQTRVTEGERVFEASCSNQYCHGTGGRGAQGPRIAGIPISPDTIRAAIREGRAGTPMAPFKTVLEPAQLEAVIAYTYFISSGGRLIQDAGPASATATRPEPPAPSTSPIAIGKEKGTAAVGAELFFDSTRLASCRTCHSYNKRGGPLGLDFIEARKTPQDILASLSRPRVAARAYPIITIVTVDGTELTGVRGPETDETLSLFDVSVPPVKRSFRKADLADIRISKRGIFDHTRLGYSRQQRLDIAALLGTPQ